MHGANNMNFIKYLRWTMPMIFVGIAISQPTVAVLDFDANGIPEYEVETLVERLRSELPNTGAVRLVDRKMLENILKEQGLQQSGCTTDECAAQIGELLGAQYMISGSIGKLENTFTVDMKMVSVSTGAAERAKNLNFEGGVGGLLIEMQILAWEIVDVEVPKSLMLQRAGSEGEDQVTVAVMDFDPRGISLLEAQTLTDRFSTEISNTGKAILVARSTVLEVMEDQGYDTSGGCTSEECAAEVGALLGVKYMINGAIGKLGEKFTIDAKMFEVATGAAARTKNATYTGNIDGLITEIEILAWEMMGLKAPKSLTAKRQGTLVTQSDKPKTKLGAALRSAIVPGLGQAWTTDYASIPNKSWYFLGGEAALGLFALITYNNYYSSNNDAVKFHQQYINATDVQEIRSFKSTSEGHLSDAESSEQTMEYIIYALGAVHIYNIVDAFLNGPSEGEDETASVKKQKFDLVYNPELNQPQLRFTIALD